MQTQFRQYHLSAKLLKEAVKYPFGAYQSEGRAICATSHNKFTVRIKNTQSGDVMSFIHYGTAAEFKQGITELNEDSLLRAFIVALDDADLGKLSFPSYCDAIGCDPELKASHKAHRRCMIMLDKFENDLLMGSDEQSVLLNLLCEPVNS